MENLIENEQFAWETENYGLETYEVSAQYALDTINHDKSYTVRTRDVQALKRYAAQGSTVRVGIMRNAHDKPIVVRVTSDKWAPITPSSEIIINGVAVDLDDCKFTIAPKKDYARAYRAPPLLMWDLHQFDTDYADYRGTLLLRTVNNGGTSVKIATQLSLFVCNNGLVIDDSKITHSRLIRQHNDTYQFDVPMVQLKDLTWVDYTEATQVVKTLPKKVQTFVRKQQREYSSVPSTFEYIVQPLTYYTTHMNPTPSLEKTIENKIRKLIVA